jgi:hypothetical protein
MASSYDKHEEHLAVVSPDVVKRKMAFFRLDKYEFEALPFKCKSFSVRPGLVEYRKWLHPLDPISLEDMKNWFGVPNELAKRQLQETRKVEVDSRLLSRATHTMPTGLPKRIEWDFKDLSGEQRTAVRQMSRNLLYGYVSPEVEKDPPVAGVIRHMLSTAKHRKLHIFAAPDLVICPDEVVEFQGVPTLYFNNILIYGNGKLKTRSTTAIHAVQIKHIA